jgi:hypothetical protein
MQSSQPLLRRSICFFWEGGAHNLEMRAARRRAKAGGRETASNSLPKPWGLRRRLQVSESKLKVQGQGLSAQGSRLTSV